MVVLILTTLGMIRLETARNALESDFAAAMSLTSSAGWPRRRSTDNDEHQSDADESTGIQHGTVQPLQELRLFVTVPARGRIARILPYGPVLERHFLLGRSLRDC